MVGRVLIALMVFLAWNGTASAHRIMIQAGAAGKTILGEVMFSGGVPVQGAEIQVMGPNGETLGTAKTDDAGGFMFEANVRCDHTFVADLGDGHRATFVLRETELPETLPELGSDATKSVPSEAASVESAVSLSPAELEVLIDRAVGAQLRPLREQLAAYEDRVRFRDIVGGIGYIVGAAGLLLLVKRRRSPDA